MKKTYFKIANNIHKKTRTHTCLDLSSVRLVIIMACMVLLQLMMLVRLRRMKRSSPMMVLLPIMGRLVRIYSAILIAIIDCSGWNFTTFFSILLQDGQPTTPQLRTQVEILRRTDTTQLEARPLPMEPRLIYRVTSWFRRFYDMFFLIYIYIYILRWSLLVQNQKLLPKNLVNPKKTMNIVSRSMLRCVSTEVSTVPWGWIQTYGVQKTLSFKVALSYHNMTVPPAQGANCPKAVLEKAKGRKHRPLVAYSWYTYMWLQVHEVVF